MPDKKIIQVIKVIRREIKGFVIPIVTVISQRKRNPFLVLISCILSLRTKDKVTAEASRRLFNIAVTPEKISRLPLAEIEKIIYPVGFYHTKARVIIKICRLLIKDFYSRVPDNLETLLKFKGVGRKTANLVLGLGFGIPAICVDTHVHRISNRLGWVRTNNPTDTEFALQKIIPVRYWIELNTLLVTYGQNVCLPVSPLCNRCKVNTFCRKVGVNSFR